MSKVPRVYLSSPHLGTQEFEFVREAFATNWIAPLGPHVDAFEKEFGQSLQVETELTQIGRKEAQKAQKSEGDGLTTEGGGRIVCDSRCGAVLRHGRASSRAQVGRAPAGRGSFLFRPDVFRQR
ncbi:MAG: hypothetical protein RL077_6102 [Verrucomicrobiota bacterium]|jgi:hypothetical protein